MDNIRKLFYSHLSEEEFNLVMKDSSQKREEMLKRKNNSKFICKIPDWLGQGGMVEFWINDDNSFESEDSRLQDKEIREGIRALLNW